MMSMLTWYARELLNTATVGLLIIVVASLCRRGEKRRDDFLTAMGFAVLILTGSYLHWLLFRVTPNTFDPLLLRWDRALGLDPLRAANFIAQYPFVMAACILGYISLAPAMAVAWVAEQNKLMRRAVLIAGIFCWFFYALIPAVGPGYYNWQSYSAPLAPRNCLPSMHVVWALLLAWNARSMWLRVSLWLFAFVTMVSIIATREHYFVDLFAAMPYTAAVQWAAQRPFAFRRAWLPAFERRM